MHEKKKKKKKCMFSVKSLIMRLLNHPRENLKFDNGLSSAGIGSREKRERIVRSTKEN